MENVVVGVCGCFIMALPFILLIWLIWVLRHRKNRPSKAVVRFRKEANDIQREAQRQRDRAAAHCLEDIQEQTRRR